MRKLYERPLAEVIEVKVNDIITESGTYGKVGLTGAMDGVGNSADYTKWFDQTGGGKITLQ